MPLPKPALATSTLQLGEVTVEIRSLTASQAMHVNEIASEAQRAVWMLACGFGISEEEASDWFDAVSFELATAALVAIVELSGLEGQLEVQTETGPKDSAARKPTSASS